MPKIIIQGIPGLDGEYDLSTDFTHGDFRIIKQVAGLRPTELQEALEKGDVELIVAMACIALKHAGKSYMMDMLWDSQPGAITADLTGDEEDAESPPPQGSEPSNDTGSNPSGSSTSESTEHSPEIIPLHVSGIPPQVSTSGQAT